MSRLFLDFNYAYLNARIKGMKSKLFTKDKLRQIRFAGSLIQFIELMEESQYKKSFVSHSVFEKGLPLIRHALVEDYVNTLLEIRKMAPENAKYFVDYFLLYYRINDLKKIIEAKLTANKISNKDLILTDAQSLEIYKPFFNTSDSASIIACLDKSIFGEGFIKKNNLSNDKIELYELFTALDNYYQNKLSILEEQTNESYLKSLISKKIDTINLLIVLRAGSDFNDAKVFEKSFLITKNNARENQLLSSSKDKNAIISSLERRNKIKFSPQAISLAIDNDDITQLEAEIDSEFEKQVRSVSSISVMSLSTVISYIFLKRNEVTNLLKIAESIELENSNEVLSGISQLV